MLPSLTRGSTAVVVLSLVGFLLGDQPFGSDLQLDLGKPYLSQWWTGLTAPFCVADGFMSALIPHLFVQWWLGGRLEMFWGSKRFMAYVFACAVIGTVAAGFLAPLLKVDGSLGGPMAVDMVVLVGFAVVFARESYELPGLANPLGAKPVAALMAIAVLMTGTTAFFAWQALVVLPGALLIAGLFLWQPWRGSSKTGKVGRGSKKPHLRVVRSADDLLN